MSSLGKTFEQLQALRRKFEARLAAASHGAQHAGPLGAPGASRLRQVTAFGSNPGNVRMLVHAPDDLPDNPALVVALHGCTQSAAAYDLGTGWSALADRMGFVVVYPEQLPANNPQNCFSWFLPADITRNSGEALSIQQMVEHAIRAYGVDHRRVFVTGLSAGGAMAAALLATYPEVYAGGAIIAGLPYGRANSVQEAFEAMLSRQSLSARPLGDRVRAASPHRGPWPRISVWHGTADPIVHPANAESIVQQWLDVHGLAAAPTHQETIAGHMRRVWRDADGAALVEAYSLAGMGHGVPLDLSKGNEACGGAGPFFLDVGLCSTSRIAGSWGLGEDLAAARNVAKAPVTGPEGAQSETRELVVAAREDCGSREWTGASASAGIAHVETPPHDPRRVIAAAFAAAGLPAPEFPAASHGSTPLVEPGPIIAAALKAAGLRP
jgi:feruloyl esterase